MLLLSVATVVRGTVKARQKESQFGVEAQCLILSAHQLYFLDGNFLLLRGPSSTVESSALFFLGNLQLAAMPPTAERRAASMSQARNKTNSDGYTDRE